MRDRAASGQASVEYIALIALAALVFALGGSFVLDGRAIAAATAGRIDRGLCIVTGHDCPAAHAPCSISSRRTTTDLSADVALVRLGGGRSAVVEHRSDGTIAVTLGDHLDAGATAGFGEGLKLGEKLQMGGEVRAALVASLGHGATYLVHSDREAAALIRVLRRPRIDPNFLTPAERAARRRVDAALRRLPVPVSRYRELTFAASGEVGRVGARFYAGAREDVASGNRTYYLKAGASLDGARGALDGEGDGQIAITVDRHEVPIDLMLLGAIDASASVKLPARVQEVAGDLHAGTGRKLQIEGHLDLTQPGRWQAVRAALAKPWRIADMVYDDGTVQAAMYATRRSGVDAEGHARAGLSFGGAFSHGMSSQRLVAAMEHTREGYWIPRYDCMAAAE